MTTNFIYRVIREEYVQTRTYVYRCVDGHTIERTTAKPCGAYANLSMLTGWKLVKEV